MKNVRCLVRREGGWTRWMVARGIVAAMLALGSACGGEPDCAGVEIACGDAVCDGATEYCEHYTGGFDGAASSSCLPLSGCAPGDCACVEQVYEGGSEEASCSGDVDACTTSVSVAGS